MDIVESSITENDHHVIWSKHGNETDLIRGISLDKLDALVGRQAIHRYGEVRDVINVIDFFVQPGSDFVTGQVIFLGGV